MPATGPERRELFGLNEVLLGVAQLGDACSARSLRLADLPPGPISLAIAFSRNTLDGARHVAIVPGRRAVDQSVIARRA
jgi:hypothetical protein